MADREIIEAERFFDHPIEEVFRRYTDHEGWSRWAGFGKVKLVREGAPERDGLGSVRAFRLPPGLREEVTRFEPPARQEYKVIAGPVPFTDHLGEVMFDSEGQGTRIRWRVSLRPRLPGAGWVMRKALGLIFRRALAGLARDLASDRSGGRA